jgi:hypothetical protein
MLYMPCCAHAEDCAMVLLCGVQLARPASNVELAFSTAPWPVAALSAASTVSVTPYGVVSGISYASSCRCSARTV